MYEIKTEQFQGPLDLLLSLIESQKLDISQIALAQVTDQYLLYLDQARDIGATELADFLIVATKLLVIKSKILLPQAADEEEDSAEALEAQLKLYKDYLSASKKLEEMIGGKRFAFTRERIAFNFTPAFSPPADLKASGLADVFLEILNRIDYVVNLPQRVISKVASLKEAVFNFRARLAQLGKMSFKKFLGEAKNRDEIIVSFMAVLELVKGGEAAVTQKGVFDDIILEKI